jgi:Fe-S-cluster containining protein
MSDRCTGGCCRAFVISGTYGEILRGYDAWLAGAKSSTRHGGGSMDIITDIHLLATMLRPLGLFTENPATGRKYDKPTSLYSCVHLGESGDCEIYDRRPGMCRNYPYGGKCEVRGCQWDAVADMPISTG